MRFFSSVLVFGYLFKDDEISIFKTSLVLGISFAESGPDMLRELR